MPAPGLPLQSSGGQGCGVGSVLGLSQAATRKTQCWQHQPGQWPLQALGRASVPCGGWW